MYLVSRHVYKEPMPHEEAGRIIIDGKSSHFNPDMVDALTELADEFENIAARYANSDEDMEKKADYMVSTTGNAIP